MSKTSRKPAAADRGRLKIGGEWNAIRTIALSQSNPLQAIAELVVQLPLASTLCHISGVLKSGRIKRGQGGGAG
ncbi:MAG: hypothetical protein ACRETZ_06260 [Steroidobacteraceae bacterium]